MSTYQLGRGQGRIRLRLRIASFGQRIVVSRFVSTAVIVLIAGLGAARLAKATPYGPGLNGDSFYYYTGAANLAAGRGFGRIAGSGSFVPTTHFPPGYPIAMAALQLIGIDKLGSGNLVNLFSLAGLIILIGSALRRESGSSVPAYVAGAILVASPVMLESYAWAMSEPLYLLVSFAGLYLLAVYLDRPHLRVLIASAALIGIAFITRYVGVALVATGLAILLIRPASWRKRLTDAGILVVVSGLPMFLWLVRNAILTGNLANRRLLWHPIGYQHIKAVALHGLEWIVPAEFIYGGGQALAMIAVIAALIGASVARLARNGQLLSRFRRTGFPTVLVIHILLYLIALVFSLSLFDPGTQIGGRILLPVYVSIMALATLLIGSLGRGPGTPRCAHCLEWNGAAVLLGKIGMRTQFPGKWTWTPANQGLPIRTRFMT